MHTRTRRRRLITISIAALALLSALSILIGGQAVSQPTETGSGPAPVLLAEEAKIVSIVKKISPSVVAVTSYDNKGKAVALGSGIIVTSDGEILTNNHVISASPVFKVTLADGRELAAKSLGGDPLIDLAIVKVESTSLPAAPLGDSDSLEAGQAAIAIGNPYGFDRTVTMGVISAVRRTVPGGGTATQDLIQTDARIYPGNSGGPLLDSSGKVIGVNTLVVGGEEGVLGFAIPINTARDIMSQVRQYGHIRAPYIGVSYGDVTPEVAQVFGLPVAKGVLVAKVDAGSPAALAGIKKGDIITEVEGKKVEDGGDLQKTIRDKKIGDRISLSGYRDKKKVSFTVTIGERPLTTPS